jgi:hypothetical protein
MAFSMIDSSGPIIRVRIRWMLSKDEVTEIQAAAVEAIRRCGKISALFILDNFQGWDREGDWGDVAFLTEHDKDIDKIAVVGDERWRDLVYAFLAKGFRHAAVEYFGPSELRKAHQWLE